MAGIGFELERLAARGDISGRIAALGYGTIVAAGPWLLTIIGLGLISLLSTDLVNANALASFRVTIIYAFANSLIITAPTAIICARLLSDSLYLRQPQRAIGILIGGLAIAGGTNAVAITLFYSCVFVLPFELALAGVVATILVAMLWIAITFCGAIYDHIWIGLAFLLGLIVGLAGTVLAGDRGETAASMVWGYNAGLMVILFLLLARIIGTFPFPIRRLAATLSPIYLGFRQYGVLALAAFLGALGLWVDKWIVWSSDLGERTTEGLPHAPIYDGAMFVAFLTVVPSLAAFIVHLETRFFRNCVHYFSDLLGHATLARIEQSSKRIGDDTLSTLHNVILLQLGFCIFLVVFSPAIVDFFGMRDGQISILRFGIAGTLFHFVFLSCSTIVLFLDIRSLYLALQLLFLTFNAVMTTLSVMLGPLYLGYGYLVACAISGIVAYVAMIGVLRRIDYYTFIASIPKFRHAAE